MTPMPTDIDRLGPLLRRFSLRAHLFHAGPLCGVTHFEAAPGRGFLHVMRNGSMTVSHGGRTAGKRLRVDEPTLLFYPRPYTHRFHNAPTDGADFTCATVEFEGGDGHPLARALPAVMAIPLRQVDGLEHTLALLFGETDRVRCGQRLLADRLFEVLLVQLLRWLLDHPDQGDLPAGLMTGLAHPQLAKALAAVHEAPAEPWSLERMAAQAGMSRSAYAAAFRTHVGVAPAEYVAQWRLALAQGRLRAGAPVKRVADEVGYGSASALSRAFAQRLGMSPRAWLKTAAVDPA